MCFRIEHIPVWYIIDENEFPGFMFFVVVVIVDMMMNEPNTTMNERTSVCT